MTAHSALGRADAVAPAREAARTEGSWPLLIGGLGLLDASALLAAFALAYLVRFKAGLPLLVTPGYSLAFYSWVAFWAVPVWLVLLACHGLYDRRRLFEGVDEYTRVAHACTAGLLAVIIISFLDVTLMISRGWLLLTWLLATLLVCGCRFGMRRLLGQLRRRGLFLTPTLIIGANEEGVALAEQFMSDADCGLQIIGFIDAVRQPGTAALGDLAVLGGLNDVEHFVHRWGVRELVVATTGLRREELLELYRRIGPSGQVNLRLSSGLFEILTTGVHVQQVSCVPLMTPQRMRITGIDAALKAGLDYIGAASLLMLLSPLILLLALLVRLDSPGPALYRRRVLGQSGKAFDALKFRTMVVDAEAALAADPALLAAFAAGYKLKEDPRVTRVGHLLRRTSLDELPQLINVLRGQMSLVGPRMIAPDEAARYGKWQLNLLTVKPGITGPWQVQGRSDIPYAERVRLSMDYIRNYSIWLDLAILLRTLAVVAQRKGAY